MIKLVACDLDGTLLNDHHVLSTETKKTIKKVKDAGIEFMVATGRSYESVMELFDNHSLECEYLVLNGALITDEKGNCVDATPMYLEQVKDVINILNDADQCFHLYTDEGTVVTDKERSIREFREHLIAQGESIERIEYMMADNSFFQYKREIGSDVDGYLASNPIVYKMETHGGNGSKVEEVRAKLMEIKSLAITNSVANNIEITHIDAQKGFALQHVCRKMGIKQNEVMTIGDSMNDYTMMELFDYSVAMKNAVKEIREVAKYQSAKSNGEDGVKDMLEQLLAGTWPPK